MFQSAVGSRPPLSAAVLVTLTLVLVASSAVYSTLVRRATVRRHWVALSEWAKNHGARLVENAAAELPPLVAMFSAFHPQSSLMMEAREWVLLEMTTDPPADAKGKAQRWHVLARPLPADWSPTGLRPVAHPVSLLDLLALSSFPSLAGGDRFMLFGTDSIAARALADSPLETLLPPDVGLAVHDRTLLLDFSTRPFDTIEFGRMIALSEQLLTHLPAAPARMPSMGK